MIRLPICILLLSLCDSSLADNLQKNNNEVDLILVAGQSNAVGYDTNPDELPANPVD